MRVADLKRELQLRGAAHHAKAEAMERRIQELEAQTAAENARYDTTPDLKPEEDLRNAIQAARDASGDATFGGNALQLINTPGAAIAFKVLAAITAAAKACDMEALDKVKTAVRAARDVVVWRCRSVSKSGGRDAFLETAEQAFGKPLDPQLRAQLLNAYHKVTEGQTDSFMSNNQLATARRGRPRKRRQRDTARGAQDATLGVLPTMPDDSEAEAAAEASDSDLEAATEALPETEAATEALPASSSQDEVAGTEPAWKQEPAYVVYCDHWRFASYYEEYGHGLYCVDCYHCIAGHTDHP